MATSRLSDPFVGDRLTGGPCSSRFEHMVEIRRVVAVLCAVAGLVVVAPAAAVGPARSGCAWRAELLPMPDNAFAGRVTGGGGEWFAGVVDDQGALWRDGRLVMAGIAFDLTTELLAVNGNGLAVGDVLGADGRQHAVRYDNRYAYLPESRGSSVAMDVKGRGDIVGYDGAAPVVWSGTSTRFLDLPTGSTAYGRPAIDGDGTVVARTGWIDGGRL